MAKVDLKAAFRIIPIARDDWELLGLFWRGNFYIDTCLPFGLRSAPFLFNQFAVALHWILSNNYGIHMVHYLDDYFIAGPPSSNDCQAAVESMLGVCTQLGVPVALEKLEGPDTTITFLGILVDSAKGELRLPADKLEKLLQEINTWIRRRKARKRELLSVIGSLSFATKIIPAGRLFLRRLIDQAARVKRLHHYVTLNAQTRADFLWWQEFLPSWNGRALFLDPHWSSAPEIELFTDASGALGFGAYFGGSWLRGDWPPHQSSCSIQWKELFAILAAAMVGAERLTCRRIRFFCDNLAIVQTWQCKSAKHPNIVDLSRRLLMVAARHNFTVAMSHLPGCSNEIADALSRNNLTKFFFLIPQADGRPTAITPELLNI